MYNRYIFEELKKKTLLFFGNCQLVGLKWATEELDTKNNFDCKYIANYQTISLDAESISNEVNIAIRHSDIVIMQPLSDKWGAYSKISNIAKKLGKEVVKIPYIFIDGLFSLYPFKKDKDSKEVICGKKEISLYKQTIINLGNQTTELSYDDPFDIRKRFIESWRRLRKIENQCNLLPSRHLIENYKDYRLMLTQNHTDSLFQLLLAQDLMKLINSSHNPAPLNKLQFTGKDYANLGGLWPIDKFTVNALELNYLGESTLKSTRSFINYYAK